MEANEEYLQWPVPTESGERMVRYHYKCMSCVGCDGSLSCCVESRNFHAQIDLVFPPTLKDVDGDGSSSGGGSSSGSVIAADAEKITTTTSSSSYKTIGTYCFKCHDLLHTELCTWCGTSVAAGTPSKALANGTWWHEECFCCIFCEANISGSIHPWRGEENIFCCKEHFIEEFLPSCVACGVPILDKAIAIFGQHYHMKCITCVECGVNAVDCDTQQVRGRSFEDVSKEEDGATNSSSWLVCTDHQASTIELSKECVDRVDQMCSRAALWREASVERKAKHASLLATKRSKLDETAAIYRKKMEERQSLELKVKSFYLKGGRKYAHQQIGESKV
jgi:hypothetical protein